VTFPVPGHYTTMGPRLPGLFALAPTLGIP
jgi:hypothetical protein